MGFKPWGEDGSAKLGALHEEEEEEEEESH